MTHRADAPRGSRPIFAGARILIALASVAAVAVTGFGWITYRSATSGITLSEALAGEPAPTGPDQNILIMGLDSRRDQHGRPLPPDLYDALHAGGEDSGDGTADALIVLHVPAGDAPATAISIPRDDYVDLAGCPASDCRGKIKEAYSYAYQNVMDHSGSGGPDGADAAANEQKAREAGRKAEISTVRRLLQIPIDHFVEITLVGFLQIARVVEPITICLNEDTADRYYSGADFHKGIQQISAAQAMAFVRQRRDAGDAMFTDLDRTRRQQAFIVSLVNALRRNATGPAEVRALLDVAKQNVAVDAGFDLETFLRTASAFPDRPVKLYTLPVIDFGEIADGAIVNFIDVASIRSIVRELIGGDVPATLARPTGIALNVVNASGIQGQATYFEKSLATGSFTEGTVATADSTSQRSTIAYGIGAKAAAGELADQLGITATASDSIAPNTVRLTVGTDSAGFAYRRRTSASTTTTAATPVSTVPATGTGAQEPSPTELSRMTADHVPCVK
jgi:LCP family protein required for cell wall assembly